MKYTTLYAQILKQIEAGGLKAGDRLPHTIELAKKHKVSHGTAAKAVRQLAADGYVSRVKSKGSFISSTQRIGYFELNKEKRIAWLFKGDFSTLITTTYIAESFVKANDHLVKNGWEFVPIPVRKRSADDYLHEIKSAHVSGAIVNDLHMPGLYDGLLQMKIPFVCTDSLNFDLSVHQVTYDHLKAGALAFKSLYSRGHSNILFFGNYQKKGRVNDPDHEYVWRSFEQSGNMEHIKNVKAVFVEWQERALMKRDIRKALLANSGATAICTIPVTFYLIIKELLEEDDAFTEREFDFVVFSTNKNIPPIRGRQPDICYWNSGEIGLTGAKLIESILKGNVQSPRIHYTPVEVLSSVCTRKD
ncbi:MAG: GntR family transcriptional regulator [Fibrobacteres bacterium]|nr:GntR family transcriptional regulator [Fibrobacterota bacterium]